jgi:hypothetical protein
LFGTESWFWNLLYIAKSLQISLTLFHALEIIFYLASISFFLKAFFPPKQANALTLLFGFFGTGSETCFYLLRELLASSFIFIGVGFLFREKNIKAFIFFALALLFHSSPILYLPLFVAGAIINYSNKSRPTERSIPKRWKAIACILLLASYGSLYFLINDDNLSLEIISFVFGGDSLYTIRLQGYQATTGIEGWRDATAFGNVTILMIVYLLAINFWKKNLLFCSRLWIFYIFTLVFSLFRYSIESIGAFWLSSRVPIDFFLLASCIFASAEIVPKKDWKLVFFTLSGLLFLISMQVISSNYENYGMFRFPI